MLVHTFLKLSSGKVKLSLHTSIDFKIDGWQIIKTDTQNSLRSYQKKIEKKILNTLKKVVYLYLSQ